MKPVPESLATSLPGKDQFRSQIVEADPGRWLASYAKVAGSLPLDELTAKIGGKVLYLQGEIQVSSAGPIRVQLDSADGIRFWVDDELAQEGTHAQVADTDRGPPCAHASRRYRGPQVAGDQGRGYRSPPAHPPSLRSSAGIESRKALRIIR